MSNSKLLSVIVFCSLVGRTVFAMDSLVVTDESDYIYGKGVHAFFDRDYEESIAILSKAEEIKNNDPRSYYFLGLAYLRQKKAEQADQYFKKAAQLEYNGRGLRDYAVSESLRRIQGEERLRIEKIRTEERANAQIREQRFRELRYGRENAADRENLQQLLTQNKKDDVIAIQQTVEDSDNNAFGIQPIDPINTREENIIARRTDVNPFGGIDVGSNVESKEVSASATPRNKEPAAVPRTERTFVNTDVLAVQQEVRPTEHQVAPSTSMSSVARQLGKTLGTMFSRKANTE